MGFKDWETIEITKDNGQVVSATAPIIVSTSRRTDIPAFYAKWFMNRWRKGYVKWINPKNRRQVNYISFKKTRLVVFWSKNPAPILKYLPELDSLGVNYYFQFTVNDYGDTGLEPHVPSLSERVETFRTLSTALGKERVIWRFDPLILTQQLDVNQLLERMFRVAERIGPFTEKLVISFADTDYRKVQSNLRHAGIEWHEFSPDTINEIAKRLGELKSRFGLKIGTCAENVDLEQYGIDHNKCIDDDLMVRVFNRDKALMDFLGYDPTHPEQTRPYLKDKGQGGRKACGCIVSKDIGMYDTCQHLCVYCYANASCSAVKKNCAKHSDDAESIA